MEIQHLFQSLADHVTGPVTVKRVFGEPISAQGKTIIPVARIGFGFGAGSGSKKADAVSAHLPADEGSGGGGGGGAMPVGVVEITAQQTRFIAFGSKRKLLGAFASGVLFGIMISRRCRK